jgi:MoaA/NifB/PqqE/SkfB family radical SAM enzyme
MGLTHRKALPLDQIRTIAERLAMLGAGHLVITGGEPFLRPDIPDIIALFKKYHFSVRVQTNGGPQVTEELLTRCAKAGLQDISVSIDTLNRQLQDEICHAKNVVENAIRTLKLAKKILPNSVSLANIVASSYNFEELPSLVRFFYEMGVYTYITPVMTAPDPKNTDPEYLFRGNCPDFSLHGVEPRFRDAVIENLISLRQQGYGLTNSTRSLKDYRQYIKTGLSTWRCEAGTLGLDILPDGKVCICKEKPPVGNILDPHFISDYRDRAFREQAKKMLSTCSGCFYGEYREPQYAIRHPDVLVEWIRDYYRIFRHGMRFNNV